MRSLILPALMLAFVSGSACFQPAKPVAAPVPPAPVAPAPSAAQATTAFILEVAAPADESVVRQSLLQVQGRTEPDAVLTINGEAVEVDAGGNFSVTVRLEEGPNSIEVLASDFLGHQASRVLTVIFIP